MMSPAPLDYDELCLAHTFHALTECAAPGILVAEKNNLKVDGGEAMNKCSPSCVVRNSKRVALVYATMVLS